MYDQKRMYLFLKMFLAIQEDLTPESTKSILEALRKDQKPKVGSQSGRTTCEPLGVKKIKLLYPPKSID